jgi:hypothetical protein
VGTKGTGTGYDLMGVGCSSASTCAAVGLDGTIRHWNGTSWASYPSGIALALRGASCVSTTFCMAVGPYAARRWDGSSWSSLDIGTGAFMRAVTCTSSTFCLAVGENGMLLEWTGSSWFAQPTGTSSGIYGASCLKPADAPVQCVLTGSGGTRDTGRGRGRRMSDHSGFH